MRDIAWVNGQTGELAEVRVPFLDRGYLFGDGVYEVIRVYHGQPFALADHLERLAQSLFGTRIHNPMSPDSLRFLILDLIARAGYSEASVYLQITRGVSARQHAFPPAAEPSLALFVSALKPPGREEREKGVKAVTVPDDRWAHCDIKSINLLPNVLAKQTAQEKGAHEAIFVREDGQVSEGSSSNVFAVKGGVLTTPPLNGRILAGVTRKVTLDVAKTAAVPLREAELLIGDLRQADEVFVTSTTMEILPVTEIDGIPVGMGVPGAVTRGLYQAFCRRI